MVQFGPHFSSSVLAIIFSITFVQASNWMGERMKFLEHFVNCAMYRVRGYTCRNMTLSPQV